MSSAHFWWLSTGSTDRPITLTPRLSNSGFSFAIRPSSVVQIGVKSLGWEKRIAQLSPIQSWNLILPSVVSALKSGAVSPIARPMSYVPSIAAVAERLCRCFGQRFDRVARPDVGAVAPEQNAVQTIQQERPGRRLEEGAGVRVRGALVLVVEHPHVLTAVLTCQGADVVGAHDPIADAVSVAIAHEHRCARPSGCGAH